MAPYLMAVSVMKSFCLEGLHAAGNSRRNTGVNRMRMQAVFPSGVFPNKLMRNCSPSSPERQSVGNTVSDVMSDDR
ncbi:hypothetical protein MT325_m022R [Paramecium bursaria chlorella virus MT325]|uniref:Uncharacterized protein m022R n=1 Tax=Paramecium bursaria Chlorella virus MT325 TaxID=346932 RepID=A7ITA2_PBCVM|nr:hypothetical protein MT325_m022R [Paramecium bursaria chlorella virus MT325]